MINILLAYTAKQLKNGMKHTIIQCDTRESYPISGVLCHRLLDGPIYIKTGLAAMSDCIHNKITRYTDGFYCNDCNNFFDSSSKTYRKSQLLSNIWMVLNNIIVDEHGKSGNDIKEVLEMRDEIGIELQHENYEEIISKAEIIMNKYGKNHDSASIPLEGHDEHADHHFCERCGKRVSDQYGRIVDMVHTCTPPFIKEIKND